MIVVYVISDYGTHLKELIRGMFLVVANLRGTILATWLVQRRKDKSRFLAALGMTVWVRVGSERERGGTGSGRKAAGVIADG